LREHKVYSARNEPEHKLFKINKNKAFYIILYMT